MRALYDFENKKVFFPAVHASFKFCVFVAGRNSTPVPTSCAFYLHTMDELEDRVRRFPLSAQDFARVNPNTGTAPIFRTRRDAELTTAVYERLPVLVNRSSGQEVKTWPLKYVTMFHMTNDSGKFRTRQELEEQEGAWPVGGNRFDSAEGEWLPLYEGKMAQAYDHRAASIVVNPENQHRPAQPMVASLEQHQDPDWLPFPWDEDRRLYLKAKLDAVFFHLYSVTDRDDIGYIYSTFPIVEREEVATHGHYRSRDLCLAWMNALAAGRPDAEITL